MSLLFFYPAAGTTTVSKALTPTYSVSQLGTKTLTPTYQITNGGYSKTLTPTYNVSQLGTKALTPTYQVWNYGTKTLTPVYSMRQLGTKTLTPAYQITNSGYSKTLTPVYNITQLATKTVTPTYQITNSGYNKTLTPAYDVRQLATKTLTPEYSVTQLVTKILTPTYDILTSAALVSKTLTPTYDIRQLTTKTLSPSYQITNSGYNKTLTPSYNVRQLTTKTLSPSYQITNGGYSKTLTPIYSVRQLGTKTLAPTYNVLNTGYSKTLTPTYNVAQLATKTLTPEYGVFQLATKTLSPTYDILSSSTTPVSKTLTPTYNILQLATRDGFTRTNLNTNPSFETDSNSDGLADGVFVGAYEGTTNTLATGRTSGYAQRIQYSQAASNQDEWSFFNILKPDGNGWDIAEGEPLSVSCWYKLATTGTYTGIYLNAEIRNSSHTGIGGGGSGILIADGQWHRVQLSCTAPANSAYFLCFFFAYQPSSDMTMDLYFDDMVLEKQRVVSPAYYSGTESSNPTYRVWNHVTSITNIVMTPSEHWWRSLEQDKYVEFDIDTPCPPEGKFSIYLVHTPTNSWYGMTHIDPAPDSTHLSIELGSTGMHDMYAIPYLDRDYQVHVYYDKTKLGDWGMSATPTETVTFNYMMMAQPVKYTRNRDTDSWTFYLHSAVSAGRLGLWLSDVSTNWFAMFIIDAVPEQTEYTVSTEQFGQKASMQLGNVNTYLYYSYGTGDQTDWYDYDPLVYSGAAAAAMVDAVPKTVTPEYNLRQLAADTLMPIYDMRSLGSKTLTPTYNMRSLGTKTLTPTYSMAMNSGKTLAPTYDMRELRNKTLTPLYRIRKIKTIRGLRRAYGTMDIVDVASPRAIVKQVEEVDISSPRTEQGGAKVCQ